MILDAALRGLAVVCIAAVGLWGVSLVRKDASVADPAWAPAFLLLTVVYLRVAGGSSRGWIILILVALWAARLGSHLLERNLRDGEDRRYRAFRAAAGRRFPMRSLFTVFLLQGALVWVVSAPLLGAVVGVGPLRPLDVLGVVVVLAGFATEAAADRQLQAFRADPERSGIMDRGLWRYSRHPNYFGDALMWWGFWIVSLSAGLWWTVVGPMVMTVLLVRISGVAMLEKDLERRKPGWEAYRQRTSAFVPWPPRGDGP